MEIIIDKFQHVTNKELKAEGRKARLGYMFRKGTKVYWNGRCPICGEWLSHNFDTDVEKFIRNGQWDFTKKKMTHCAKTRLCSDYYQDWLKCREQKTLDLFMRLKKQKIIA